jgi:hypothetical protein
MDGTSDQLPVLIKADILYTPFLTPPASSSSSSFPLFLPHVIMSNTTLPMGEIEESEYGYIPSRNVAITFLTLFGLSTCTFKHARSLFSANSLHSPAYRPSSVLSHVVATSDGVPLRRWCKLSLSDSSSTAMLIISQELIGWYGRYWSSSSPTLDDPYMMQCVL